MRNTILILLLSFNLIFSQTDSLEEALKYYPLHIGDYWQYEVGESYFGENSYTKIGLASLEIVGDTVLENGKKYFNRVAKGMESYMMLRLLYIKFLRIDSTSGMVYGNDGTGSEFIIDSLLASPNDTVEYFVIDSIIAKNIWFGCNNEVIYTILGYKL